MYRRSVLVVLVVSSAAFAENLLLNPSFTDPPVATPCAEDWQDIADWQMTPQSSPAGSGDRRNGDYKSPPCPRNGDDTHASLQGWATETKYAWQTVTGLTTGQYYKFSGLWFFGHTFQGFGGLNVYAEMRTGDSPTGGTVIGSAQRTIVGKTTTTWLPFQACGQLTTGTELTVVIKASSAGWDGFALHFDNLVLEAVDTCVEPNSVDSIDPVYEVRGATVNATITGYGFVTGQTSVKLTQPGQPDIPATNVVVNSPTVLTCRFNLTGAANGRWNVVANFQSGSPSEAILSAGFLVVLPSLSNGSFELPTAPGCPSGPNFGHPTDWLVNYTGSWGDSGYDVWTVIRDDTHAEPACPPPDGIHYASTYSVPPNPGAQPESHAFQTVKVDNTKSYTFSGYFAGDGNNTVTIELLDGDEYAGHLNNTEGGLIHDNGPEYDWTFAYIRGTPTTDLMTVRWRVSSRNPGPHVAHADALRLDICSSAVTAVSITPADGDNTGTLAGLEITGSGFSGGSIPKVMLSRTGLVAVNATNVVVHNDTRLTCDLDLSNQPTGLRDVIVFKDGCVARIDGGFVILAPALTNEDFELPDPGQPVDCTSPEGFLKGVPQGWSANLTVPGSLDRDHHVYRPVTCPSTAGGHYGSLTIDRGGDLVAYQSLRVIPTAQYTFAGMFAGGGTNQAVIQLIDGSLESGTLLAETSINGDTGGAAYDWRTRSVAAHAKSEILTVAWRLITSGQDLHALHADGLTVAMTGNPCSSPFADADADGDVDQVDFAVWQTCFTGSGGTFPADPPYCRCFDRDSPNGDGDIDLQDYVLFEACASGPGIPANAACAN
ncbi:MAG: hypothetical protein ACUVXJ_14660 [Phycisphaerae bacterium]